MDQITALSQVVTDLKAQAGNEPSLRGGVRSEFRSIFSKEKIKNHQEPSQATTNTGFKTNLRQPFI